MGKATSPIKWVQKLLDFIQNKDGLEAWMRKYLADLLVIMEQLVAKAGQDWLAKVEVLVIEAAGKTDMTGQEKLAWVIEQITAQSIASLVALSSSEINALVEYIVSKCKTAGVA